jgi:hypothetical protein
MLDRDLIRNDAQSGDPQILKIPLMATSVQELPNGNWLIANGFSGREEGVGAFSGEVFEVAPGGQVEWCSPALEFSYPMPGIYAWTQKMKNSYIFQQPRSAVRQY